MTQEVLERRRHLSLQSPAPSRAAPPPGHAPSGERPLLLHTCSSRPPTDVRWHGRSGLAPLPTWSSAQRNSSRSSRRAATTWYTAHGNLRGGEGQRGRANREDAGGRGLAPRAQGWNHRTRPRSKRGAGEAHGQVHLHPPTPFLPLPPFPVTLTVLQPHCLQRQEQSRADVLAVPAGFSQDLGHCGVKGMGILAGLKVRSRIMTS